MKRFAIAFVFVACFTAAAGADRPPARGTLLVATGEVRGEIFANTVILLLHYDETGAMGIVVNRPTDIAPEEIAVHKGAFADYGGTLYWGGPVQMDSLSALMRSDDPPEGAELIVGSIHRVPIGKALEDDRAGPANLRLYIGYAGWSAGQLDDEMARGSWHVVAATDEHVFTEEPRELWQKLAPPKPQLRVAVRAKRGPEKGVGPQWGQTPFAPD